MDVKVVVPTYEMDVKVLGRYKFNGCKDCGYPYDTGGVQLRCVNERPEKGM
jgi:hypothetical protein